MGENFDFLSLSYNVLLTISILVISLTYCDFLSDFSL